MRKTIHDAAYDELLNWLKDVRTQRKQEAKGACTMRALVPQVVRLLGRPKMKFSWIAKIEQKERRLDILEYVAYCMTLKADPHEGLQKIIDHLSAQRSRMQYSSASKQKRDQTAGKKED